MKVRGRRSVNRRRIEDQGKARSTRQVPNGSLPMSDWTKPSGKPSLPVTRYRLFKTFVAAKGPPFDAGTFLPDCVS